MKPQPHPIFGKDSQVPSFCDCEYFTWNESVPASSNIEQSLEVEWSTENYSMNNTDNSINNIVYSINTTLVDYQQYSLQYQYNIVEYQQYSLQYQQ